MSEYQPARCNIGRAERRDRLVVSAVAFAVAAAYAVGLAVGVVPSSLLVGVFVPLAIGFEWGVQAYASFCVRLALLSRYDLGPEGESGTVSDPRNRRVDRVYAAKITAASLALAAVTTGLLAVAL